MDERKTAGELFEELVKMAAHLRGPDGCSWDRKQTLETIRPHFLEEAHEAAEAVSRGDFDEFREEIGDTLFLTVFLVRLAEEEGKFAIADSLRSILEKMKRRHPHVYGDAAAPEEGDLLASWEKVKQAEKGKKERDSILDGVPATLPALLRARRLQQKAANIGFDWPTAEDVLRKIKEEAGEVEEAVHHLSPEKIEDEIGDLLFSVVNLARFFDIDPEAALNGTNRKFRNRFRTIEDRIDTDHPPPLEILDRYWEEAKKAED